MTIFIFLFLGLALFIFGLFKIINQTKEHFISKTFLYTCNGLNIYEVKTRNKSSGRIYRKIISEKIK
jgi:hypothetical protein